MFAHAGLVAAVSWAAGRTQRGFDAVGERHAKADRGASPTSRARLRVSEKAGTPLVEVEASLFSDPAPETMSGNPDVNFNEERAMVIAADYPCDSSPSSGLNTSQERGNDR
ncbi:MAG TPA: hypothetical protein VFP78_09260 [Solirubrobacteraceae bacterium]|nr:hypothetical protein [Solirubrobacteraceae bacterium]